MKLSFTPAVLLLLISLTGTLAYADNSFEDDSLYARDIDTDGPALYARYAAAKADLDDHILSRRAFDTEIEQLSRRDAVLGKRHTHIWESHHVFAGTVITCDICGIHKY
ncbi:hypothetical protein MMC13_007303 [Lambiella insularis]|nr:hypothetical protein [Lambiella insularis]